MLRPRLQSSLVDPSVQQNNIDKKTTLNPNFNKSKIKF